MCSPDSCVILSCLPDRRRTSRTPHVESSSTQKHQKTKDIAANICGRSRCDSLVNAERCTVGASVIVDDFGPVRNNNFSMSVGA
jgi:hypothetical protein